jgi:hypothetical protein
MLLAMSRFDFREFPDIFDDTPYNTVLHPTVT